jgi:hypothetical protein
LVWESIKSLLFNPEENMEPRFRALRTIASIFRVVGYIILVLTILAALGVCGASVIGGSLFESTSRQFGVSSTGAGFLSGLFGGLLAGVLVILYGGLLALSFVAFGEGIYLLLGIEENTRKTTYLLENQAKLPPPESKPLPPAQ